jgi:CBS domain-containing protein
MKIEDILESKGRAVETIRPDAPMTMAIHRITTAEIGALVVSPDGAKVEGTLSERDICWALARHGTAMLELRVADCMTRGGEVCGSDAPIREVMAVMTRRRQRHIPVVDDGRLSGIVSLGDVVKNRLDELELEANVLREAYIAHR